MSAFGTKQRTCKIQMTVLSEEQTLLTALYVNE